MAFATHLYLCGFFCAASFPLLQSQQCQVVVTSEDVIRTEVRYALENITEQIRCLRDQVNRLNPYGSELNPAASCASLLDHPLSPSGYYWVRASNGSAVRVYCDMTRSCGGVTGGWVRVAELDMTDSQQCPSGLRQNSMIPTCVSNYSHPACSSVYFDVPSLKYSKVCGMIRAYQIGSPGTFNRELSVTVEQNYVDGISLTHGHPRQHIWTFAAAHDEISTLPQGSCPCININQASIASQPPAFVGNDYFCDTASVGHFVIGRFYSDDPLWDGAGCGPQNTCCSFNNPPWFYKQLPQPTTDDVEMRVCRDETADNEDVAIEAYEIYVQ